LPQGWPLGTPRPPWRSSLASNGVSVRTWAKRFLVQRLEGLYDVPGRGAKGVFSPELAIHVVRLACEPLDTLGRRLSQWDCQELARHLVAEGLVDDIAAATVRRMLASPTRKPWCQRRWRHPKPPRDAAFSATVSELIDRYTRPLGEDERVLSVDEQTAQQPRPRPFPTLSARSQTLPHRHEHASKRAGARTLFAAFDTRSGKVYGPWYDRQRQPAFIAFLEPVDREIDARIRTLHLMCDNVSTHHGQAVRKWLAKHPRFVGHFMPVLCAWMNQVEQWFSIRQRKRLRSVDFESKDHLRATLAPFIREWNQHAHPFNWSIKSGAQVMAVASAMAA
jgi:transposase